MSKLSQREGNPVFSPSRLLAAVCRVAPLFKVLDLNLEPDEKITTVYPGYRCQQVTATDCL